MAPSSWEEKIIHIGRCTCRKQLLGKDPETAKNDRMGHSQAVGWPPPSPKSLLGQTFQQAEPQRPSAQDPGQGQSPRVPLSGSRDLTRPFLLTHYMCMPSLPAKSQATSGQAQFYVSLYPLQCLATAGHTVCSFAIIPRFNFRVKRPL